MKINGNLTIDFDHTAIFQDGLKLTSVDEHSSQQNLEVYITENIDTANNTPIVMVLDESTPILNGLLQVKRMTNPADIIIGVLTNKIARTGEKIRVITRGIVQANYMFAPILNKIVYATDTGTFTTLNTNPQLKAGRIINVSPCKIFIDINNQLQYKTNFENFGSIESKNLEATMRKLTYLVGSPSYKNFAKPWFGSGTPFLAAWNTNPDKKIQGIVASGAYIWHTEDKGATWTLSDAPTDKNWKQVIFAQNKFVAIGVNGFGYSDDGLNWNSGTSATGNAIAYGNGFFLTVGSGGFSYYSQDAITWTAGAAIPTLNGIAYSPVLDMFFAVGGTDVGRRFTNALSFYTTVNNVTLPSLTSYESVVWGVDKFLAGAGNGISWSFDGGTFFTNATTVLRIGYGNMMFISGNKISTDGINWTLYNMPPNGFYTDITSDNFVYYTGDADFMSTTSSVMIL